MRARMILATPQNAGARYPSLPAGFGVSRDGPGDDFRRLDGIAARRVVSQGTLAYVTTIPNGAGVAVVAEAYFDGDTVPFDGWLAGLLWVGTMLEFRALFASATARGASLRAAWPSDPAHRRWAVGDVEPVYQIGTGRLLRPGVGPNGAPRFAARIGLQAGDTNDTDPDSDADAQTR